ADLGGGGLGLLALDADQGGLVLAVGEPDLEKAVGEECNADDGKEQRDIFAKQRPADLAPAALFRNHIEHALHLVGRGCQRVLQAIHYSITSSASASKLVEMSNPSALAVFKLMLNSYLLGCWTGNSAGLAPFRSR